MRGSQQGSLPIDVEVPNPLHWNVYCLIGLFRIPEHDTSARCDRDLPAVGDELKVIDGHFELLRGDLLSLCQIPQADNLVVACRYQPSTQLVKSKYTRRGCRQIPDALPVADSPQGGPVGSASCQQGSIGTELDTIQVTGIRLMQDFLMAVEVKD
jgi:hypothetical protein